MPSVLIERREASSAEHEVDIMEAVHSALRDAFRIKPTDRNVRLMVHEPHRFMCPPGKDKPEAYTHVSIDAFAGRSVEAKRALYKAIVNNFEALGIPKDHVKILVRDVPLTDWGIRGGQAACDVELGFELNV